VRERESARERKDEECSPLRQRCRLALKGFAEEKAKGTTWGRRTDGWTDGRTDGATLPGPQRRADGNRRRAGSGGQR
jgi:hypothetical protein